MPEFTVTLRITARDSKQAERLVSDGLRRHAEFLKLLYGIERADGHPGLPVRVQVVEASRATIKAEEVIP